ncbi:MAG: ATP cone domain-containing protein, partial [Candidatus Bipolaricaulis sp.]|nr:ATP cone domain-containing protein [Candidatus Bipolaricaulis sp.]
MRRLIRSEADFRYNAAVMAVVNKIGKIRKRNHALVAFDQDRIVRVILRASTSVGGFEQDYLPGINDRIFAAGETDEGIAQFLSDLVVVCLNADERHHVSNFPPTVEEIQNVVLHVLSSNGFTKVADAYTCFRWGHHWVREGAITEEQFVRNGYPAEQMDSWVTWNREHDCDTVEGL